MFFYLVTVSLLNKKKSNAPCGHYGFSTQLLQILVCADLSGMLDWDIGG